MRHPLSALVALFSLALCGCGPDPAVEEGPSAEARAFAAKVCAARHECGCVDERFATYADCGAEIAKSFDEQVKAGATVDTSCLDEALANESLNGCPAWVWDPEMWSCPALVKSKKLGASCSYPNDLEPLVIRECEEGLLCLNGVCAPETDPPAPKTYSPGDPCTATEGCGGMYCGYDHRCHDRVLIGGPCDHPHGCEVSLFCEGLGQAATGICAEQKLPNEACDPRDWSACASPNFPDEVNACDPDTNTCAPNQPGICRLTHALIARQ